MNYRAILDNILQQVDTQAYLTPSVHVDPRQRLVLTEVAEQLRAQDFDPDGTRAFIDTAHAEGRLDRVHYLSALHVVAASPRVQDWALAARLVGEQEFAAMELGGPDLQNNLASGERHRGVLAFLRGHYEPALDYFSRALERQRTAENLGNVLCALVRLGELEEARHLLAQIRATLPVPVSRMLDDVVLQDPDLALLRSEA